MSDRTSGLLRATAVSGLVTLMLAAVSLAADPSILTWEKLVSADKERSAACVFRICIRSDQQESRNLWRLQRLKFAQ
jgi:hypothetical protein